MALDERAAASGESDEKSAMVMGEDAEDSDAEGGVVVTEPETGDGAALQDGMAALPPRRLSKNVLPRE